jgi:predicted AAA+ superfamily ATPase
MIIDWTQILAAVWRPQQAVLRPVQAIDPVSLDSLVGIERQKHALLRNTERLLAGLPANNALLWGARGTGKSSLVKALLNACGARGLRLVQVHRTDLYSLPDIVDGMRELSQKFIVYCDDFSFELNDDAWIGLKTVLDGSIEQPPDNVLIYATSNRRHLLPESMQDNLDSKYANGELHYADAIEEKLSLSDRFGLWLSFYAPNQDDYFAIVDSYFPDYPGDRAQLHAAAKRFALARGGRSGRAARQFYNAYSAANGELDSDE